MSEFGDDDDVPQILIREKAKRAATNSSQGRYSAARRPLRPVAGI